MKLPVYQIDAFADQPFEGNPAAVIPLQKWLPVSTMQAIAEENNLSETAFFIPTENAFHIRWFTPSKEVKLCGHATLAAAHLLFSILGYKERVISFESLSGMLMVSKVDDLLTLDFPAQPPVPCEIPDLLSSGLGAKPKACLSHDDYVAVFETEEEVKNLRPNYEILKELNLRGVIATAVSSEFDFIARFFAPKLDLPEDPVTGSAYTQLMPYWAEKLNTTTLNAKQISRRGGKLYCQLNGDRVFISGKAVTYMEGSINIKS